MSAATIACLLALLLVLSMVVHPSRSAVCVDSPSLLQCQNMWRPVNSFCVNCCQSQENTTSAISCTSRELTPKNTAVLSGASAPICLPDGGFRTCANPPGAPGVSDNAAVVTGVCLATGSCLSPCNAFSSIGRLQCRSIGIAVDTSNCAWVYGNGTTEVGCIPRVSVLRGVCLSASPSSFSCGGSAVAAYCCRIAQAISTTRSLSASRTAPSATVSSASVDVPSTTQTASTTRASPTGDDSNSFTSSASMSAASNSSEVSASPTTSRTAASLTPSSSLSVSVTTTATLPSSATLSIPSPTPPLDVTTTPVIVRLPTSELISRTYLSHSDLADSGTVIRVKVHNAVWRQELIPFLDQNMSGTQPWNPFAFDQQKETLYSGVTVVPQTNATVIDVHLRADRCYDAREAEMIHIDLSAWYVEPVGATAGLSSSEGVTVHVAEDPKHETRRAVGLVISIVTTLLLLLAAILGNPGVSLLIFCEFQLTNLIGRQTCSRGRVAAYFDNSFWIVSPTLYAPAFASIDPQFGIILVHFVVSITFFTVYVAAARKRKRWRMLFPSLPLSVVYVLFIGGTNGAWQAMVRPESAGPATASAILWVLFIAGVGLSVWRIRSPRGLVFLKYHGGFFAELLHGTHSPLQLRGKYSLLLDPWNEDRVEYATPLHLTHLSISSIVSACSWSSTLGCFVVLGVQLAWQCVVFFMIVMARPGRSPFHNGLLFVHSATPICVIVAQLISLDCLVSQNFNVSEAFTVMTQVIYFLSATCQVVASVVERKYRAEAQRELKAINAKHRSIVFNLDRSSGAAVGDSERLPMLAHQALTPKLVDPDWRSKRHKEMYSFPLMREAQKTIDGDAWTAWQQQGSGARRNSLTGSQPRWDADKPHALAAASGNKKEAGLPSGWRSLSSSQPGQLEDGSLLEMTDIDTSRIDERSAWIASSYDAAHDCTTNTNTSLMASSWVSTKPPAALVVPLHAQVSPMYSLSSPQLLPQVSARSGTMPSFSGEPVLLPSSHAASKAAYVMVDDRPSRHLREDLSIDADTPAAKTPIRCRWCHRWILAEEGCSLCEQR